jgi:hypothetical protein
MPGGEGASRGPHVPRDVFLALSYPEQEEVRRRVFKYATAHTKGSTIVASEADREDLAHQGILWMLGIESCEYLEGSEGKGMDTLVSLAASGVSYAYLQVKTKHGKTPPHVEYDENKSAAGDQYADEEDNRRRHDENPISHLTEEREELSALLQEWFTAEIVRRNGITEATRKDLRRVIDLIFDPNVYEDFYTFSDGHLGLKAGPISRVLGLNANWISKHGRVLNEILSDAQLDRPIVRSVR